MSDSLNNKELVLVGRDFAKALSSDTPIIDIAKVLSRLADRLDVTAAALREKAKQRDALATENAGLKAKGREVLTEACSIYEKFNATVNPENGDFMDGQTLHEFQFLLDTGTPNHDAFLAEVRAKARREGAHFVANRMLAAWDAGFIDDTAKNAADIAQMILTSTEFMADAPEGDFDRSFADGVLEDIAAQLRKGGAA
ncbi:hypothetical protein [Enterobacter sp. RHBSTW-00901]|uniref:hypothetical protein n=1 Tax=Enterobacter sp. RHBSTW-00901 TaxID=2742669 RepID=UPI0020175211|nr:hypothetical protein [Enterobacter sp. RHBSTW-00901]